MRGESHPFSVSLDLAPKGAGFGAASRDANTIVRELAEKRPLELLTIVDRKDDLAQGAKLAKAFGAGASEIFLLGIGGSSLGAEALSKLAPGGPKFHFCDNPDPVTFGAQLANAHLKKARFLAVSKSGGTAETMIQSLAAVAALEKAGVKKPGKHFVVLTEPKKSALKDFAADIGCPVLDHPLGIGGRYSVLSLVGLFPAMLMGLNAAKFRAGARAVLANPQSAADGAALHFALGKDVRETVLWSYADALKTFGAWWRQLWAESLGKEGKGITPVAALGPVDQHSQLQLFLDGPKDMLFTVVSTATAGKGPKISKSAAKKYGVAYLGGHSIGDLVAAQARATAETLAKRGRPVRQIHAPKIDETAMGALFMHFMLETIAMGRLMGIDPFDQPAVEEGKVLARTYLEGAR